MYIFFIGWGDGWVLGRYYDLDNLVILNISIYCVLIRRGGGEY